MLDLAKNQIEERDEFEALEAVVPNLIRLDRYQRREWSWKKPAVRDFMKIKLMGQSGNKQNLTGNEAKKGMKSVTRDTANRRSCEVTASRVCLRGAQASRDVTAS